MISGPGGVGKGTVVRVLLERWPELALAVSATTRPPRPGEENGREYHFVSDAQFDKLVTSDALLEWATFGGRRYGTPWSSVRDALEQGRTLILEIDVQGALQVRERFADALLVFLAPPSIAALRQRLRDRGTDSEARIAERLAIAERELAQAPAFDHVVTNEDLNRAAGEIGRILFASSAADAGSAEVESRPNEQPP